jgi:outer membrane protein assembly factor BamB
MKSIPRLPALTLVLAIACGTTVVWAQQKKPAATKPAKKPPAAKPTNAKPAKPASQAAAPGVPLMGDTIGAKPAKVGDHDWAAWGGTSVRNNTPEGTNIPTDWDVGGFNRETGEWEREGSRNIKWVAKLGSQTYGNPSVANGKVFIGTNNGAGWLKRYPATVDLGVLLAFNDADGSFLWQHSSDKLPTGRVHDWPLLGLCSTPLVEGDRLWVVTSRNELACLDTEGFLDGENDGPFAEERYTDKDEADTVWMLDFMKDMGVSQHNAASCSVTAAGDVLFVCTSNGVDEAHNADLPAPNAPSFVAVDKNTGKVLWTDKSPGLNILHGQWSSPAYAVLGGQPQAIFAGGDGWIYSFDPAGDGAGGGKLLWKFDCNPKESKYSVESKATRNHIIGTPVVYKGNVYIAVGEDPEHGEGVGHLWCIDPTKRGDVSPQLVFNTKDLNTPIPHKRLQACVPEDGDVARDNPNSAAVWHYAATDVNGDGKIDNKDFKGTMHRTVGSVAIKDDLLVVADFSGLIHCLDALTGKVHWTYDMLAATWGSPLIVDGKIYVGDEDGDVAIFALSPELDVLNEDLNMGNSVYSTPIVANNTLYISNKTHLFAIQNMEGEGEVAEQP